MASKTQDEKRTIAPTKLTSPAEQAAAEIRGFHALGVRVLGLVDSDEGPIQTVSKLLAKTEGIPFNTSKTAAYFARLCGENKRDLGRICMLCNQHLLSVNHVQKVLRFKAPGEMVGWLERATRGRWTATELAVEVAQSIHDPIPKGGRPLKKPGDLLKTLVQVIAQSDDWLKRCRENWDADGAWPPIVGYGDTDRSILAARLELAKSRLVDLGEAAKALGDRLERLEISVRPEPATGGSGRITSNG